MLRPIFRLQFSPPTLQRALPLHQSLLPLLQSLDLLLQLRRVLRNVFGIVHQLAALQVFRDLFPHLLQVLFEPLARAALPRTAPRLQLAPVNADEPKVRTPLLSGPSDDLHKVTRQPLQMTLSKPAQAATIGLQIRRGVDVVHVPATEPLQSPRARLPFAVRQKPRRQQYSRVKRISALAAVVRIQTRRLQYLSGHNKNLQQPALSTLMQALTPAAYPLSLCLPPPPDFATSPP
jgi:hypothetical protein